MNTEDGIKPGIGQITGKLIIQGFVGQNKESGFYAEHNQAPLGSSAHRGGNAMSWDSRESL